MIAAKLVPKLQARFAAHELRLGKEGEPCVTFPAVHPEVGDVLVYDDRDEATVVAGNFTHGHFGNYDEGIDKAERAERIADDVVQFLDDLFSDRIVLWGSHRGGGGWRKREVPDREDDLETGYVWSGPLGRNKPEARRESGDEPEVL